MRKTVFLAIAAAAAAAQAATLDGIAAKVNDSVITVGDVMHELRRTRDEVPKDVDFRTVYTNVLERLIDRKLILAAAVEKKLDMQEWMVDNRVREIVKDGFGGDINKLNEMLDQAHVQMTDWRNEIRDDMIVQSMRYQLVERFATPTPAEMRREYNANRSRYRSEAKVTVSVILLRPPDGASVPSVETRGEEILARIEKGEDFAALARKHSSDSHAKDGGVWKDVRPEEVFRPEIAETISRLKPGEFSRLVNLDGWGFIVRKDAETAAKERSFAEAYEDVERSVKRELAKKGYAEWTRRLREAAFVKIYPLPDDVK